VFYTTLTHFFRLTEIYHIADVESKHSSSSTSLSTQPNQNLQQIPVNQREEKQHKRSWSAEQQSSGRSSSAKSSDAKTRAKEAGSEQKSAKNYVSIFLKFRREFM
jgi:hypothetical protein